MTPAPQFVAFIEAHPRFFKKDKAWFSQNWHVVQAFERIALQLIERGRRHYSARTIVEVLVHQSQIREIDGVFKIGNDNAPDLARVFVTLHPERLGFWEYRRRDWPEFVQAIEKLKGN